MGCEWWEALGRIGGTASLCLSCKAPGFETGNDDAGWTKAGGRIVLGIEATTRLPRLCFTGQLSNNLLWKILARHRCLIYSIRKAQDFNEACVQLGR